MANLYKVGRNDPCPCGSGKKYKKCCLNSQHPNEPSSGLQGGDLQARDVARPALQRAEESIRGYDPFVEPHADHWLALDEQDRIDLVMDYHRDAGIRLPREKLHAVFHAIVESQIADPQLPVRRTAQRLMSEGLDRHEAVHAIGSVLAGHINDLMRGNKSEADATDMVSGRDPNEDYFAELEALTAENWLRNA
nr:SEC-C metal-binding domain-containing protein [Bradyrhizobium diazoefficiens]